ncbi:ABC transporter permease [Natrialbaceae archaeon A-CW1-1]
MGLGSYILKRATMIIPVFIGITVLIFLLLKLTPGDPVNLLLPPTARTEEQVAATEARYGLNEPVHMQYLLWLSQALQGDLGLSFTTGRPVSSMITSRIWPTAQLGLLAMLISLVIAIPAGVVSAVFKDSWIDQSSRIFAFIGISIPSFWLGIMIILVFSLFWQGWFGNTLIPPGGYASPSDGIFEWLRHALPPAITLGVGAAAINTRLTRSAMLEVLNEDYIDTARSKGVKENTIVLIHALRNALIPIVTVLGMQIGFLMNGAVVVEQVFQWPGIGRLLYEAVLNRDMPLLQGLMLFIAAVFVTANLLVDILYAYLDPRIKY